MTSAPHELTLPARRTRRRSLSNILANTPRAALLTLTALLYLWGLSRNGYANDFYAAAVKSGTESWKAFFFGSLDRASYITVDKPPAALWLMELSGRIFGFSSFSMLLPQALEGVAAVWLLYATVRRWFSAPAALLSGLILAVTPVAALMFRFNNPDALLVLLLVVAGYAVTRALERANTAWLTLAGAAVGFAFITKMMQAFLVLPGLALVYLLCAPTPLRRRVWQLLVAGLSLVVAGGWWVAIVALLPASSRPYIGGSTNNSIFDLIWGYNGLGRLEGAGGGGANFSGVPGFLRLFNSELGGQISWLLPAALTILVAGLAGTWQRPRVDRTRSALILWGGWLVVSAAVYSYMSGGVHPYYTNTLAPAIAVLTGAGGVELWQRRDALAARTVLGLALTATAAWSYALLDRIPTWHPTVRLAVLIVGLATVAAILTLPRLTRGIAVTVAAAALFTSLAGPTAYTLSTVSTTETGTTITAGPALTSAFGGGGLGGGPGGAGSAISNTTLDGYLTAHADGYTWVAATSSSGTADPIILATSKAVMALAGFNGGSAITLDQFKQLVTEGKIHYYITGGGYGGGGGAGGAGGPGGGGFAGPGGGSGSIKSWVTSTFKSVTVGGTTLYDLSTKS